VRTAKALYGGSVGGPVFCDRREPIPSGYAFLSTYVSVSSDNYRSPLLVNVVLAPPLFRTQDAALGCLVRGAPNPAGARSHRNRAVSTGMAAQRILIRWWSIHGLACRSGSDCLRMPRARWTVGSPLGRPGSPRDTKGARGGCTQAVLGGQGGFTAVLQGDLACGSAYTRPTNSKCMMPARATPSNANFSHPLGGVMLAPRPLPGGNLA